MSEHVPNLKDLNQINANGVRFQDAKTGKFVSGDTANQAKHRAQNILLDTIMELSLYGEDITKADYERYAADLGLEEEYKSWLPGTAVKKFDKQRLLDDTSQSRGSYNADADIQAAEITQHDERQATYDKMALELGPETDEQADQRIANTKNQWRIAAYNEELRATREQEQQEKAANYAVEHVENINQKTITELATLLGETPNFQMSKADYVARVEARRDQLVADREARNTVSATDALGITNTDPSESTQETVRALKAFQKRMLTGATSAEVPSSANPEAPLVEQTPTEAAIQLREELRVLLDKKQAGELDEAGKKDIFKSFAILLAATKAAARAEGKTDEEIKQAALDVEKEYADNYGLIRKRKLPLPATAQNQTTNNEGKGRDKWGTPGRGDLEGKDPDLATRPKTKATKEKKRHSIRRKLGAAAMGIIAIAGLYNLNRLAKDDDSVAKQDKTEQTATTTTPSLATTTTQKAETTVPNNMIPKDLQIKSESLNSANGAVEILDSGTYTFSAQKGLGPWQWMRSEFGLQGREDILKKLYENNKELLLKFDGAYANTAGDVRFRAGPITIKQADRLNLANQVQQLLNKK